MDEAAIRARADRLADLAVQVCKRLLFLKRF